MAVDRRRDDQHAGVARERRRIGGYLHPHLRAHDPGGNQRLVEQRVGAGAAGRPQGDGMPRVRQPGRVRVTDRASTGDADIQGTGVIQP